MRSLNVQHLTGRRAAQLGVGGHDRTSTRTLIFREIWSMCPFILTYVLATFLDAPQLTHTNHSPEFGCIVQRWWQRRQFCMLTFENQKI